MFQATWVQVDVLLDARQTWTYFNHADSNGSYSNWAKDFRERTNSTYEHSVSQGYFITGMVVWFFTPLLLTLFISIAETEPFPLLNSILGDKRNVDCTENINLKVLLKVVLFPFEIICAAVFIYLLIPFTSLKRAFKIIMRHKFEDDEKLVQIAFPLTSKVLPILKGFEFIGEAVPQLILSIVFMANNYDFMRETQTFIGLYEFEVTLTSMVFSMGSIVMGLYAAIPLFIDMMKARY